MANRELQSNVVEIAERRRDPRVNRPEAVKAWIEQDGERTEFQAVLVNISDGGLSVRHWRKDLKVGQEIFLQLPSRGELSATVMWNWTVGPVVISGLEKLQSAPILGIDTRRRIESAARSASEVAPLWWLVAGVAGILVLLGWYLGSGV